MSTQTITVNKKEIQIVQNGSEKYVAIKPICQAIGIDFQNQINKLKEDDILSELYTLRYIVGADSKSRKMATIPLKYVFGWLFTINSNNVKEEVKSDLIEYKKQCYDALFETFTKRTSIIKEKTAIQIEIDRLEEEWKESETFQKIKALKAEKTKATKKLNELDKSVAQDQLDLFNNEEK
jgi:hypothetical protein